MSNIITEGLLEITKRVKLLLNLDDDSRINNFYLKQRKQMEKDIKNLNKNLDTLADNHNDRLEELNEKLEDAKQRVEEAYTSVTPEDVATNEKATNFVDVYWAAIEEAEEEVTNLEKVIEDAKENYNYEKEQIEKQIAERQRRLAKLV